MTRSQTDRSEANGPHAESVGWRPTMRTMHEHEHGEQRFGAAAQAAEWDAKYSERDGTMWSGRPNGRLVAEVADLNPGRALDVGCGEGADAIWLARRGWTVTAIDISEVAVTRAREAAELAGVAVECVCRASPQTHSTATPASSAASRARVTATSEMSIAVTVQPLRASQIASAPSPQPTSSARPGVRSATSAASRPFGRPLHIAPSRSLYRV